MILPIQILNDLISTTEHKLLISNVITNADGSFTLYVNYTYYLNSQRSVIIDGITYRITDFALNESITVTGSVIPTATEFTIDPPIFKHGTPKKVDGEIANTNTKSYPFIWLLEFLDIDYNDRFADAETVTPDLNLFFLTDTYYQNWDIDQHYTEAIHPMLNEIDFFIRTIKKRRDLFGELESHTITNHVNFGEYITNKGYDQEILNGQLSGCQLKISLPYVVDVCNTLPVVSICNPVSIYENEVFKEYVQAGGSFYYTTGGGDVTVNFNGSELTTVTCGDTYNLTVINSADDEVGSDEETNVILVEGVFISNSDNSFNATPPAETSYVLPDVTNIDSDSTPVVTPAQTPFVCTPCVGGSISTSVLNTGQETSYQSLDDGARFQAGDYASVNMADISDFYTLVDNNEWGHKKRFTGDTGGYMDEATGVFYTVANVVTTFTGAFPNSIIRDYCTRRRWYYGRSGSMDWTTAISTAHTDSRGGETGWYCPNKSEYNSISSDNSKAPTFIDSRLFNWSSFNMWTSTTNKNNSTQAFRYSSGGDAMSLQSKTVLAGHAYVKIF